MEENLQQSIKYIVYLTVCQVNHKIYVGVHKTPDDSKFDGYLGCGVNVHQPSSYKNRSTELFPRAVNKYGPDKFIRVTLFKYDTLEEALNKEAEIVNLDFLKRKDVYNMTLGGGYPPQHSAKLVHQYDLQGNYLNSYASIVEASMATHLKAVSIGSSIKRGGACGGFYWSFTKADKIEQRSDKTAAKRVGVYNSKGELIKEYPTIIACKKDYCGCVHVLYGTRKTCKGCTFKFMI